ncbi:MAG: endonuclease domain-containing protein [bacterium]
MSAPRTLKGAAENKKRASALRSNMTAPELVLWTRLRSQQMLSCKFRRQHGIGPYIVDFFCAEKKMVIEIDGESHGESDRISYDAERESYLRSLGLTVIRYTNHEVMKNVEGVLEDIAEKLKALSTSPGPSPPAGRRAGLQRRGM